MGRFTGLGGDLGRLGRKVRVETSVPFWGPGLVPGGPSLSPVDGSPSVPFRWLPTCGLELQPTPAAFRARPTFALLKFMEDLEPLN